MIPLTLTMSYVPNRKQTLNSKCLTHLTHDVLQGQQMDASDGREESWISAYLPAKRQLHSIVLGNTLVVHFSYKAQRTCLPWRTGQHLALLANFTKVAKDYCSRPLEE